MKGNIIKFVFVFGLIFVLLTTTITPGTFERVNSHGQQNNINISNIKSNQKNSRFSLQVFGKNNLKNQDATLSTDDASQIFKRFQELKTEMTQNPFSEKTQELKRMLIDLLAQKKVIPNDASKGAYLSLLIPQWTNKISQLLNSDVTVPQPFANRGTCILCSIGGEGSGILIPLFLLPRPRIAMLWMGDGVSTAANLFTGKGYIAGGLQTGLAFGFMGIGLSYALPGYTLYGFIGYALLSTTTAGVVEHYPPNRAPTISAVTPTNGEQNAPVTTTELKFRIQDPDGDLMSYAVTTNPDIGSASGNLKPFGVYKVPISGLQNDKIYRWTVQVSDGKETTTETYSFFTEGKPPFDPFTQGWNYRKKITINHTQVTQEFTHFPVLISISDHDLQAKTQTGGDDILFMDNVGVATKLYHEIEYYDSSTGTLVAWVNVPVVHSTQDTSFYMYYGNPSSDPQQFSEKVWNSDCKAVWHLNNNPLNSIIDSTSNDNDGSAKGTMASSDLVNGRIGPCLHFDGLDDFVSFSREISDSDVGSVTAWVKTSSNERCLVYSDSTTNAIKPYILFGMYYNGEFWFARDVYGGGSNYQGMKDINMNDDNWHFAVWTSLGSGSSNKFYLDGTEIQLNWQDGMNPDGVWFDDQTTDGFSIGGLDRPIEICGWNGLLDEVRIIDSPLTSAWINTEYANQNNPTGFVNLGPEEPGP